MGSTVFLKVSKLCLGLCALHFSSCSLSALRRMCPGLCPCLCNDRQVVDQVLVNRAVKGAFTTSSREAKASLSMHWCSACGRSILDPSPFCRAETVALEVD